MAHPSREERAQELAESIHDYIAAYVARHIHMSGRNEVIEEARIKLAQAIAQVIK